MKEIRRYLGLKEGNTEFDGIIEEMMTVSDAIIPHYFYSYSELIREKTGFRLKGTDIVLTGILAKKHFDGCKGLLTVLATLGLKSEILLKRYFALNAQKAVVLDAVYTDKLEQYLDSAEEELKEQFGVLTTRISCGYGDLPLSLQKPLFDMVGENTGVSINECFMLSPNKSVIALIGVK